MLDLLKSIGWFLLVSVVTMISVTVSYWLFMNYFGYRWSIRSVERYLSYHGRGNFAEENRYIIGVDIITRLVWVTVFSVLFSAIGVLLLPNWLLKGGLLFAVGCFLCLMSWMEMHFSIRIGRLASVDEWNKKAYFEGLDGSSEEVFCYEYESDNSRDLLLEKKKYIVADFVSFKMFGAADEYEWGDMEWPEQ